MSCKTNLTFKSAFHQGHPLQRSLQNLVEEKIEKEKRKLHAMTSVCNLIFPLSRTSIPPNISFTYNLQPVTLVPAKAGM